MKKGLELAAKGEIRSVLFSPEKAQQSVRPGRRPSPVIIHVLNLSFDEAVNAFAVRAVGEPAHHAQSVRPLLLGKQPLDRNHYFLAPLAADADHFLF